MEKWNLATNNRRLTSDKGICAEMMSWSIYVPNHALYAEMDSTEIIHKNTVDSHTLPVKSHRWRPGVAGMNW